MSSKPLDTIKTRDARSSRSESTDFSSLSGNEGKIDEQKYNPDPRYSRLFEIPDTTEYITWTTEAGCDFKIIQKATLEKCVQTMMSTDFNDGYFQECFVLAYKLVTTPEKLIELLGILFDPTIPEGISWENFVKEVISPLRLKIMNFVRTWIKNAWRDFDNQEELFDKLKQLLDRFEEFNPKMSKIIQKQIEIKKSHLENPINDDSNTLILKPIQVEKSSKFVGIFEFHPIEFARQITLIQNELFRKIPYNEFLGNGWMKKEKEELTPNIMKLIRSSQKLFHFVQNYIVGEEKCSMRAVLLHYFLMAADEMKKLNNFEGMKAVFSALESSPVFRLKDSWDGILSEDKEIEHSLNELCDQSKNFSKLREVMKIAVPPCLPFVGSTMSDLVFTDDGNKEGEQALINWFKVRGIGNLIKEIMVKQAVGYPIKPNKDFMTFYNNYKIDEDQDRLYDASIKLESKRGEMTPELEKKIAKLKKEGNAKIKKYAKHFSK